jgi:hypothetical protein
MRRGRSPLVGAMNAINRDAARGLVKHLLEQANAYAGSIGPGNLVDMARDHNDDCARRLYAVIDGQADRNWHTEEEAKWKLSRSSTSP